MPVLLVNSDDIFSFFLFFEIHQFLFILVESKYGVFFKLKETGLVLVYFEVLLCVVYLSSKQHIVRL